MVFGGQIDLLGDEFLGLFDKAARVAPGNIAPDGDKPMGIFAADLPDAGDRLDFIF